MSLNPSPTELSTAATDALLALFALWAMASVIRLRSPEEWKARTWAAVFGLLAVGAALGAFVHGFIWTPATRAKLWVPIYLSLALTVALFVAGAIYDGRGYSASRKSLPALLTLALAFFASTQIGKGNFLWFVAYELAAMLGSLGIYGYLTVQKRVPGAWLMLLGIALTIMASLIQATKVLGWGGPVPVNSDGIFHLVQMAAIVVLVGGLRRGLISPVDEASRVRAT
jgi:Family of unknown function (DUF6962)